MAKRKKKKKGGRKSAPLPAHHQIYQDKKNIRKKIQPGFWSKIDTELTVKAKLAKLESKWFDFPEHLGKYITHDDGYEGDGYRALVKISVPKLQELLYEHGIDEVLAACEVSLNSYKNKYGKKVLGDIVICEVTQEKLEDDPPCITCLVKTNRRRIPKFMGMSKGMLQVF